jgi:hypothetical protein
MTPVVRSSPGGERGIIVGLAIGVVAVVALYLGLRSTVLDGGGTLMPYQMLVRDLVTSDQAVFDRLRQSLVEAEAIRARTGQWPEASAVTALAASDAAPASGTPIYNWRRTQRNIIVNYLGLPDGDASSAAWLLRVQEPDPAVPTDSAPNDEEHHRLPDGTVLHVSIWTHRFGGQVAPDFFPKPEMAGWTQLLTAPLNPLLSSKNVK